MSAGVRRAACYSRAHIDRHTRGLFHLASEPAQHSTGSDNGVEELFERRSELSRGPDQLPLPLPPTADSLEALALARRSVELASDKLASEIVLLDIRGVSLIADYFVICSVGSERQATAIVKDLSETLLAEHARKPLHTEGKPDSGWVLLDYGDVIVHIFSPTQRTFYDLERLWAAATPIVRLQ